MEKQSDNSPTILEDPDEEIIITKKKKPRKTKITNTQNNNEILNDKYDKQILIERYQNFTPLDI